MVNNSFFNNNEMPKICMPIIATSEEKILEQAELAYNNENIDLVEWRCDYILDKNNQFNIPQFIAKLKAILKDKPLICTLRTAQEGGQFSVSNLEYANIMYSLVFENSCDFIDVELLYSHSVMETLVDLCKDTEQKIILSYHNFNKTPPKKEMMKYLQQMVHLQADICKIAVMPQSVTDLTELFQLCNDFKTLHPNKALIAISMDNLGILSRISGEFFGSCITFGSLENISAPGQLNVKDLKSILSILHTNNKMLNNKI